jgi:DNA-binding transcriptional LysR family regulator
MDRHQRARRRLKLRQLEILLAVADTGSMAKAATRLAITQPAISRALADAEQILGVPLFDRGAHGVEPTQYGRALLKRGIAAVNEIDEESGISSFSPIRRRASSGSERPRLLPKELFSP